MMFAANEKNNVAGSRFSAFLSRYHFLVQLITIGIILLFAITLISSVFVFSRSYQSLQSNTDSAMETMGETVCDTMNEYLDVFESVRQACLATPYTYEPYVSSNITANPSVFYANNLLRGYSLGLPIVKSISLYYNSNQRVLYTDYYSKEKGISWDPFTVFAMFTAPELDQTDFLKTISEVNVSGFYMNEVLLAEQRMMYLVPVSINQGVDSRRVLIFDIAKDTFENAVSCMLGTAYSVDCLYWKGICIYKREFGEERHTVSVLNQDGFGVDVSISNEAYEAVLSGYSASIWKLIILSMLLCAALIALYIAFSYRPLNQIVRRTGVSSDTDELTTVHGYIAKKEQMESDLRSELENEREHSRLKEVEMLLLGIPFNTKDSDPLQDGFSYHFVAVVPLLLVGTVNDTIRHLKKAMNITSFEQYRSGYFVMIVGSESQDGREEVRKKLSSIGWQSMPVGIGSPCTTKEQLHKSYIDAIAALKDQTESDDTSLRTIEQKDYDTFRSMLMANDAACIQTVEDMFRRLDSLEPSYLYYWHSNMRLIEQLSETLRELGYRINDSAFAFSAGEQDIKQLRDSFLKTLTKLLAEGPNSESDAEKELEENIIVYINDNLSNDTLCVNDIADTFNLSEYTVSHMIREKTGMYFKRYLTMVRLDAAKEALASSEESIQDISQQCGFASASYFIRVFKNETGVTPLQYRHSSQTLS